MWESECRGTMLVFVYGTLMRGGSNHQAFLGNMEFLGDGMVEGFALYCLGDYPGAVREKGMPLYGEVYRITPLCLEKLDFLEEEGDYYLREETEVVLKNGKTMKAWIYLYNRSTQGLQQVPPEKQPWKKPPALP